MIALPRRPGPAQVRIRMSAGGNQSLPWRLRTADTAIRGDSRVAGSTSLRNMVQARRSETERTPPEPGMTPDATLAECAGTRSAGCSHVDRSSAVRIHRSRPALYLGERSSCGPDGGVYA